METLQTGPLIDAPSNRTRKIIPISVIVVVIVGLILSILTQPFAAPSIEDAAAAVETSLEQAPGEGGAVQPAESGRAQEKGVDLTGGLAWIGQIVISFIALLSSIGELTGVKVSSLFSSGKAKTNVEEFPFHVIQDFDALLEYLFPEPKIALISDRSIPYLPQIRDETDAAFQGRGLVLIRGRSKTGKTREACELLRRWWYLGPTVLVARSHVTLKPPFKIPANLPTRNLVLVFDDIDRYLGDAAALRRLDETLRFFQSICHDRGEVRVIATARQEEEFWRRLGYDAGQSPWTQFDLVQLDPLTPEKAETVIAELARAAEIEIAPEQARGLAEKNDGTFLNLALAFRGWMSRGIKTITAEEARSFEGALKSTWRRRYEELVKARPIVGPVYAAVDFMQSHNLPLRPEMIGELAAEMSMGKGLLTVLGWFDRLRAWADRAPALNWYRSPKTRARGWALIIAGGLALLYLLIYGFLRFAPGDLQNDFSRSVYGSIGTQLLCLTPLWALVVPFAVYMVINIARNRALRRTAKTLDFLMATEVPLRGNELRPYENQFENNGRTRNWDLRCYDGGLPDRRFALLYAPRLASVYLELAERLRLNGEVSAARELAAASCRIAPSDPAAPFLLGKIAFDGADYRGAIDLFATSRRLYGRSNNACRALEREALGHLYLGNCEAAASTALEALRGMPTLLIARWTLGLAQLRLGKKLEGEQHCRQAVDKRQPVPVEVQKALEADEGLQAVRAIAVPAVKGASAGRKPPTWRKTVMKTLPVFFIIAAISATFLFLVLYFGRQLDEEQSSLRLTNALLRVFPGAPALLNQRANNYAALGNYENAMADFSEAIQADPKFSTAYVNRGWTYFVKFSDSEKAIADMTEAIRIRPQNKSAYAYRGNVYWRLDQYDQAIADCMEALRIDPQYVMSYNIRGLAYQDQKEYQKAMSDFSEAIRLDPEYQWAYANRGNVYKSLDQYEQAIADYTEAIRIDPQYAWAYTLRGQAYEHQGEYEKAIADYTEAIRIYPQYDWAYALRGLAYEQQDEYEKAIADYTEAIRIDPQYDSAYALRGQAYEHQSEYEKAIADYTEAIRIYPGRLENCASGSFEYQKVCYTQLLQRSPNDAKDYINRGKAHTFLGEFEKAVEDYTEAIRIDPTKEEAYKLRGDLYYSRLDEPEKAIADYSEVLRVNPNVILHCSEGSTAFQVACYTELIRTNPVDGSAYYHRGEAYEFLKEYDKALLDYDEAIRINPQVASFYIKRGDLYFYKLNQPEKASRDYAEAVRIDPDQTCTGNSSFQVVCYTNAILNDPSNLELYRNRGKAYSDLKEYEKAILDFTNAIRLKPNDANLYELRGKAYYADQQYENSIRDYTEAIRLDPKNEYAYQQCIEAYYKMGNLQKAREEYAELLRMNPKSTEQCSGAPAFRVICYSEVLSADSRNLDAYLQRGNAYSLLAEYDKAIHDLSAIIRIDPQNSDAYGRRANTYLFLKEYEKAIADYTELIEINPQDSYSYMLRGDVYFEKGDYEQAIVEYTEAIRLSPKDGSAYNHRGKAYQALGKEAEAQADFKKFKRYGGKG